MCGANSIRYSCVNPGKFAWFMSLGGHRRIPGSRVHEHLSLSDSVKQAPLFLRVHVQTQRKVARDRYLASAASAGPRHPPLKKLLVGKMRGYWVRFVIGDHSFSPGKFFGCSKSSGTESTFPVSAWMSTSTPPHRDFDCSTTAGTESTGVSGLSSASGKIDSEA